MDKSDLQEILKRIDERFEEADKRIDARFQEAEKRIDARFKGVDARFDETNKGIDARFQESDKKVDEKLLNFYHSFIKPDFDRIHAKLTEHDAKFNDILGNLDALWKKLETLEQEYHAIVTGLKRLEERFDKQIKDKESLEKEVLTLKGQMQSLQSRLEDLERRLKAA